jgi:gluconate 2-dehydrogenase gamma chain
MADVKLPRRDFLKAAGAAGATGAAMATGLAACSAEPKAQAATVERNQPPETWVILTPQEAAFFTAAADTIIPKDELSPSGSECGVPTFIDRQLASAWGGGDRMYRAGPYVKGTPEQGYQLPLTPHQFFVAGVAAANVWCEKTYGGRTFDRLEQAQRNEALSAMQKGTAEFDGLDAKQFFGALLTINMEGFFSDPIYGGNRDKASWRMIGFPGLPATYADKVDEYRNKRYVAEPQSIADFS